MHDAPETDRCPAHADRRGLKLLALSPAPADQQCAVLDGAKPAVLAHLDSAKRGALARLIRGDAESRAGSDCRSGVPTAAVFALAQSRPVRHFLVAAAFGLVWSLFWMLLLSASFAPPDGAFESIDRYQSPLQLGGRESCGGGGMIDLDGSCVLGEELELRPPLGWSRR